MSFFQGLKNLYKLTQTLGKVQASAGAFDGASHGRALKHWGAPSTGPNVSLYSHATLVNRSRDLSRNDPWGATMKERKVTNMVGTGIKPRSMVKDKDLRDRIQKEWALWVKQSDFDGVLNFYGQQELLAGEWYDAGECFARKRIVRDGRMRVPLKIQLIEAEQVPVNHNITAPNGNFVTAGIERDNQGRRAAYWMYREHPNEPHVMAVDSSEIIRIPAGEIIHTFQPMRAGQMRGLPTVTPILSKLYQVTQYDDATLMRQWVAGLFAGILKTPAAAGNSTINPLTGQVGETDADGFDLADIESGTVQQVPPGYEMDWNSPPDAGSTYGEFMRHQLMGSAAAIGMSYEILTGDLRGINDRLLRALLQEFRRRIRMSQQLIIAHQFCQNIWEAWMDLAVLSGALDLPDYESRRDDYQLVRWVPEKWQYLNPVQDVQADKDEVRAGFTTRSEKVAERGGDIEDIDYENQSDQQRADELGLLYDTDPRKTSGSGVTQARPSGSEFTGDDDDPSSQSNAA